MIRTTKYVGCDLLFLFYCILRIYPTNEKIQCIYVWIQQIITIPSTLLLVLNAGQTKTP
jgi:uncharacterized membrane protein